jgi:hypothetical protein
MRIKPVVLALTMVAALTLAAPCAQAQFFGGYVGFGNTGVYGVGGTVVGAPVVASPVVPVMPGYPAVVAPAPIYRAPYAYRYGPGWGYGPRYNGPRNYGYRYGRRWW